MPDDQAGEWKTGARLRDREVGALLRQLRARDVVLLQMLGQHHHLTTTDVEGLFFAGRRYAQKRLRTLAHWQLVCMWWQLMPRTRRYWMRRPSVWLLTEKGAAVVASIIQADPAAMIARSRTAARSNSTMNLHHDLEANAFMCQVAMHARPLTEGLYHWVSADQLRRDFQERRVDLAPDAWGRYLTAGTEVGFHLEWDAGTESVQRIREKAKAYADFAATGLGDRSHVLWVAPSAGRESSIRGAVLRIGQKVERVWTTNVEQLAQRGHAGAVWLDVNAPNEPRRRLAEMDGPARTQRLIEHSIGKPDWWDYRPGAGEGA